jgi:SAM-dependent methyltransferase
MPDLLKAQYEALPYPHRDPEDERRRVILTQLERLPGISHFVYGGAFDRSRPFRALVAGGGTGDALIALACQLRAAQMPGELVYIDLSAASRAVAEARAAVHRLDNVRFETGSFLEPGRFAPASFDYINCSGVLHHLESPEQGLRALARLLQPRGGIGVMLYGALGRTGIYPAQELLLLLAPPTLPIAERVRLARRFLDGLPPSNWLRLNAAMSAGTPDDAELFDYLLHSRDRAYSVEEIGGLAAAAQMRVASFIPPAVYRPAYSLKDAELLEKLSALDPLQQAACAEKLSGCFSKHELYLVHADNPVASPDFRDPACFPLFDGFPEIPAAGGPVEISVMEGAFRRSVRLPEPALRLLRLIDGARALEEIHELSGLEGREFANVWSELYAFMHGHGYIHLSRDPMPNLQFQTSFR